MRDIQKTDIVGARVVGIHETYELSDMGLECRQIYFTVDRGFTFITPTAGFRWTSVELPGNAKRFPDEFDVGWFGRLRSLWLPLSKINRQIKKQRISGVYCGSFNKELGLHYPSDGTIVFEDGSQAFNTVVAPHGTGGAGLYFSVADSGQCKPLERLVDYFAIPLEKPKP